MPLLRTIELVDIIDRATSYLLRILEVPSLEIIRLYGCFVAASPSSASQVGKVLHIFLAASSPPLQDLSLSAVRISSEDFVPVLEYFPHITSLRLSCMNGVARFLETIVAKRLCLEFDSLIISRITFIDFDPIITHLRKLVGTDD
ncbi:hypothetical protein BOTBODRAFT_174350 [Botryobasidium botryosum FD-172 SS1]|uniref:F-box domain-containing protein n=1 Tax=Botryobasidium botryosum (strain FD-172 SS1) TaxID=930990 RepID=A0A067MJF8_BOTB1|nr:hypothetical protein BOTBODRAFT_174350 [Botryobasidium botryosum FD-172 SS1]